MTPEDKIRIARRLKENAVRMGRFETALTFRNIERREKGEPLVKVDEKDKFYRHPPIGWAITAEAAERLDISPYFFYPKACKK